MAQPKLLLVFCLAASFCGCSGAAPLPGVSPKPVPQPILPRPPWQAKVSVAGGFEAQRPIPPPVLIRGATLMLGTGVTISRGSLLLKEGKIAAVAEGDIAPPSGAVVVDAAGQ